MKRRFAAGLMAVLLLFAAGCNSSRGASDAEPNRSSPAPSAGGAAAGFPVTVQTANGPVVIDQRPSRVVLLDDQLVETAAAIGVSPVGAPEPTTPLGPWAEGKIDQQNSEVFSIPLSDGVPVEQVAAFRPDLIVAHDWLATPEVYAKLTKLAPTVTLALNATDAGAAGPWENDARVLGQATGRSAQAEEVITAVHDRIQQTKARHPQIAGKTFQLGNFLSTAEFVCTNSEDASSAQFLTALGLKLGRIPGAGDEPRAVLPKENFSRLNDVDLVIMGASDAKLADQLADDPIFTELEPVHDKTAMMLDLTWVSAYNIPTALSIPALLDKLDPYLDRL